MGSASSQEAALTRRRCRRGARLRRAFAPASLILVALTPAAAQQAAGQPAPLVSARPPEHPGTAPRAVSGASPMAGGLASSRVDPVVRWRPYIAEAARRFGLPAAWIERVMRAESGGRLTLNGRPVVSRSGAMGLMQLMPITWAEMRAAHGLGPDPFDPKDNILAGTAYLAALYRQFGYPGLFGAYNAGPARYGAWLARRGPLPEETRVYLARVGAGGDPEGLFEVADASTTGAAPARRAASAGHPDTALGEPRAATASLGRSAQNRLFAVDRAGEKVTGEVAPKPAGAPAGGLFVALSNAPPRSPED